MIYEILDANGAVENLIEASEAFVEALHPGRWRLAEVQGVPTTTQNPTEWLNDLTAGAAAALDTLSELAAALNNDPAFAATIAAEIANRVRFDAAQTLTQPQMARARANIGAQSAAAIGDPDRNLVADYTAAKA